jgi:hypothetical protein
MTFEELNKKPFFELCDLALTFPNVMTHCAHFSCLRPHFAVNKQREIVQAIIDEKIDPRNNYDCKRAKQIVIEILMQLHLNNDFEV